MNQLLIRGTQKFSGKEIPVVLGGFGQDKKCMSDKTISEIHNITTSDVRKMIGRNISRFKEMMDFIDFKSSSSDDDLLKTLGYSKQQITQAEHIYILSERGYAKLIKIMDSDLAWEIHDKLIDEYFQYKEKASKQVSNRDSMAKVPLSSANNAVKIMTKLYQDAGVDPSYIAIAASKVYKEEAGLNFDVPLIAKQDKLYDKTTIAEGLGICSLSGKPHPQYVGAIISSLNISDEEVVNTPYTNHGHSGVNVQYTQSVYDKVEEWLRENGYPESITSRETGKKLKVKFMVPATR